MLRLTPIVKRDDSYVTVIARYAQIMSFALADNDAARDYRNELLGPDIIAGAPTRYYEIASMHNLGIGPKEWARMPLAEQGEHIAYLRLSNMSQTIERHEQLMEDRRAKLGAMSNE